MTVNSYGSLPIEKQLTFDNVITHIKLVLNKDKNHYYYKTFQKNARINKLKNKYKFLFIV